MFFNNDDDEDFGDDFRPIEELLKEFQKAKLGEKAVKLDEEEIEFLIDYFESIGDKENIKFAFDMGCNLFPFSSNIMLRKTEWLMEQTKFGQALKLLDDVDLIDPYNIDSLFLRVDILTETNKQKEAIQKLEEQLPNHDAEEQCDILIELSELHDDLENFDDVYLSLKRVLVINPQHEDAMLRICFWADITNQQEDAIDIYKKVLDLNPFNTVAWYNLGVAYQGLKMYENAVDSYTTCIDLDDKFEYAYRNLGDAHIQLKQFDLAIEVLEKHLTLGKPEDVILEAIGFCWEKKKQYANARNFYRQASSLNPSDDDIFYKIGETYSKEMQWEKAIKSYTAALALNKNNASYCIALANCLMEMGGTKEALILYLNAVRIKPSSKTAWLSLVRALYHTEMYEEGISQLDIAEKFCGDKPEFTYYRATILLAMGKTKDAVLYLETALTIAPKKLSCIQVLDKGALQHPSFTDVIAMFKKK
jgi:tetratricopeptide (TPR) repeat protein